MDYNDINIRLQRIYVSVDQKNKYGMDVTKSMRTKYTQGPGSKFQISFVFGHEGETPENLNQITTVMSNIANLKDCLKSEMEKQGKDKRQIKNDINSSRFLPLVLDLANQEKHGYPLKETRRSKKDPLIKNIEHAMAVSNKPDGITYMGSNGENAHNVMIVITADITDSEGKYICSLEELVEGAISDWEKVIDKYSLQIA